MERRDPHVDRLLAVHPRHPEWAGNVMDDQSCTFLELEFDLGIDLAVFWQREWARLRMENGS